MAKPDGGCAFPTSALDVPFTEASDPKHRGMTLRDYFAAKAIVGVMASDDSVTALVKTAENKALTFAEVVAVAAYELADAMLAKRDKE